jgi:hypothetical protein
MSTKSTVVAAPVDFSLAVIQRVDPTNLVAYVVVGLNEFGDKTVAKYQVYDLTDCHIIMKNLKAEFTKKDGTTYANTHRGQTPGLKLYTKADGSKVLHISRIVVQE